MSCAENANNVSLNDDAEGRVSIADVAPADTQKYEEIRQHLENQQYPLAEAKLQSILSKFPRHSGALANLGLLYSETNRLEMAEKTLIKAIVVDRNNPQIYLRLALVYKNQGKLVKALETYRSAIEVDTNNAKAHYNIAIIYDLYMQDRSAAILHLKKYQDISGKHDKETAIWIKQLERDARKQQTAETSHEK